MSNPNDANQQYPPGGQYPPPLPPANQGCMSWVKNNKWIILIIVILALLAIWYFFLRKKHTETGLTGTAGDTGITSARPEMPKFNKIRSS